MSAVILAIGKSGKFLARGSWDSVSEVQALALAEKLATGTAEPQPSDEPIMGYEVLSRIGTFVVGSAEKHDGPLWLALTKKKEG
jgi:hypothetical protein